MGKSSTQLMLRFQAGEEQAFAQLFEAHQRTVLNIVYRYLGNQSEAEDLAQEVFIRVYRSKERYSPQARFTTWLFRITANLCLNYQRDKKRRYQESLYYAAPGEAGEARELENPRSVNPEREIETSEREQAVREAINALPETQRLAVILNRYEELSYKQVALSLDLTEKAVKSLLHRARLALREKLTHYLKESD